MTSFDFYNLFTSGERFNIYLNLQNSYDFWDVWEQGVRLSSTVSHDAFGSLVDFLNVNNQLDDETRYATIMALQPV